MTELMLMKIKAALTWVLYSSFHFKMIRLLCSINQSTAAQTILV